MDETKGVSGGLTVGTAAMVAVDEGEPALSSSPFDDFESVVLVRDRGASLEAAWLLAATVARRVEEAGFRFRAGLVVLVPFAVRVVVDPSGFLTYHRCQHRSWPDVATKLWSPDSP